MKSWSRPFRHLPSWLLRTSNSCVPPIPPTPTFLVELSLEVIPHLHCHCTLGGKWQINCLSGSQVSCLREAIKRQYLSSRSQGTSSTPGLNLDKTFWTSISYCNGMSLWWALIGGRCTLHVGGEWIIGSPREDCAS